MTQRCGDPDEAGHETRRLGRSSTEQAAGAAASRTGSSRNKWRLMPRTGTSGAEQE